MPEHSQMQLDVQVIQAHPWHGVDPTAATGGILVYIENTPLAMMKYEVDEATGLLKVDHPHETSALPPAAYGFVPRTLCGPKVAQINSRLRGDRAALDVFVLSDRPIEVPGVLAEVRIIGGVPVKDESFVDDKLISVLLLDSAFGQAQDISELPIHSVERICHYLVQESVTGSTEIGDPFGYARAQSLLEAGLADYAQKYPM